MAYTLREELGILQRTVYRILGWPAHEDWNGLTEDQQNKVRAIGRAFEAFEEELLWMGEEEEEEEEHVKTVSVDSEEEDRMMDVKTCVVCGEDAKWMCPTCKRAPFCGEVCYKKE